MTTSSESGTVRHLRLCEVCGEVDDAPRHVVATRPGDSQVMSTEMVRKGIEAGLGDVGVAEALDNSTTVCHMDCCAQRGCPDGTCDEIVKRAGKRKGADLTKFITSGKVDDLGTAVNAPANGSDTADGSATTEEV